jgi:NAD(P)-dependent dehydrogenase (short-subunit alcohol dehydrogenase family)
MNWEVGQMATATAGRVAGKVCLVTGAGNGIGRAIAERLGEEGGRVLCVDIKGAACDNTAKQIVAGGGEAFAQQVDVAVRAELDAAVRAAVERWGGLHILVNNAGVNLPGTMHPVSEDESERGLRYLSDEDIDRTVEVNLKGVMHGCRAAIPVMLDGKGGSIVNISSVNGLVAEPYLSVYTATKHGVVGFTKGVSLDYARRGIRCNAICPGWVDTPINYAHARMLAGRPPQADIGPVIAEIYNSIDSFQPVGRPLDPREIANAALFIASDEASGMTGSIVSVDGAMTAQ